MTRAYLAVTLVVLTGCAVAAPAQDSVGDEAETPAVASAPISISRERAPLQAEPFASWQQPEPVVAAEPVCSLPLDLTALSASYEGWEATMLWDTSARRFANQLDAEDLARMVWASVETWRKSGSYAATRESAVRATLGHVGAVIADQDTVDASRGASYSVPAFTYTSVAKCTHTVHGHMISDAVSDAANAHVHELMHSLSAAAYGDADGNHTRAEVWGSNGLWPQATKLFYSLYRAQGSRVQPKG